MRAYSLLIALVSCQLWIPTAQAQSCEQVLQVGAWNIQWLGNSKEGKREPQTGVNVASYISSGGVSVLALAEITATSKSANGNARNETLDEAFQVLNALGRKWKYQLFEKRQGSRAPDDQWTGLAWDESKVSMVGGPWKLDVTVDPKKEDEIRGKFDKPEPSTVILSRWPYAAKFSAGAGKTDFVVVPVHLKSNGHGAATAEARAYEVELILQGLEKLRSQHMDRDLIVLGDSNMLSAGESAGATLRKAGLKDCNARDFGTYIGFRKGEKWPPFDRVFVMADQPETRASCPSNSSGKGLLDFKVIRPEDWKPGTTSSQFVKLLSDHMMVRTGICVQKDDD